MSVVTPRGIKNIVDARDVTDTTGAGTDEYTLVWDNDTTSFILMNYHSHLREVGATSYINIVANTGFATINSDVGGATIAGGGISGSANTIGSVASTNAFYATIGGGYDNINDSMAGTIAGGAHHVIDKDSTHSGILSGSTNDIVLGANYAVIAGGSDNTITGVSDYSSIVGGTLNTITTSLRSSILGGTTASISTSNDTIVAGSNVTVTGGSANVAFGNLHTFTTSTGSVLIGSTNTATTVSSYSVLLGQSNTITSSGGVILGKSNSIAAGSTSVVVIGEGNAVTGSANYSIIAGGNSHILTALGVYAGIFAGFDNNLGDGVVSALSSVIVGGYQCNLSTTAQSRFAGIFAGRTNSVQADYSATLGGQSNTINSGVQHSVILGGNTITATSSNTAYAENLVVTTNSRFGHTNAVTAFADVAASTTIKASLRIRSGTAPTTPNDGDMWKLSDAFAMFATDATTNAVVNTLRLRRSSSGTAAAGFGSALNAQIQSSTTAGQDAGRISWSWITATHASRASRADFTTYYTSTERTSLSIGSNATVPLLSFYGATLVAKQAGTGETTGFTAGSGTAVNDDSTFTGNVGATAYRISDIVKALKNYGLLTS